MILRSGRILDALDYVEMPENTVATAMTTNMIIPDRKQVLVDSPLRNKRMIGLNFKNVEKERRGTLMSLFKTGRSEAVHQVIDILLELTLTKEENPPNQNKPPKVFDLDQYMTVYERTYESFVNELLSLIIACDECGKPTWETVGHIISSMPLDRVYGQNICLCTDNLLEYCSYDENHYCIYFAKIAPNAKPAKERPFTSDYVQWNRVNMKESDMQSADGCDNMDEDRFDGGNDNESYSGSMRRLDARLKSRIRLASPTIFTMKAEEESDDEEDQPENKRWMRQDMRKMCEKPKPNYSIYDYRRKRVNNLIGNCKK